MFRKRSNPSKSLNRFAIALVCSLPGLAMADWIDTLNQYAKTIQAGLYLIAGTLAVVCLVWSGVKWMISRANNDHSHTFMDYLQQTAVVGVVGGSAALAAAAWQFFGN